jgi:hypothetical protein
MATWASLLEEEMEAGPEREPEVEYEGWGYYLEVMEDNSNYNSSSVCLLQVQVL